LKLEVRRNLVVVKNANSLVVVKHFNTTPAIHVD